MTISRYANRKVLINGLKNYRNLFKSRNIKQINQYDTPKLLYPTGDEIDNLAIDTYYWKEGDRYYKVAAEYYDDPTLWWVIAWFNSAPTESHLNPGDVIFVPTPLEDILNYYGI